MAVKTSFFNGIEYNASSVNDRFSAMFSDGLIVGDGGIGNSMAVTLKTGMTLTVAPGVYHIKGALLEIYEDGEDISLPTADTALPRIDAIVAEYNLSSDVNNARVAVVKGAPASAPSAPELSKTPLLWQMPLAYVQVPAGALTAGAITDGRAAVCRVLTQTYNYGTILPESGNEGDIFFLVVGE